MESQHFNEVLTFFYKNQSYHVMTKEHFKEFDVYPVLSELLEVGILRQKIISWGREAYMMTFEGRILLETKLGNPDSDPYSKFQMYTLTHKRKSSYQPAIHVANNTGNIFNQSVITDSLNNNQNTQKLDTSKKETLTTAQKIGLLTALLTLAAPVLKFFQRDLNLIFCGANSCSRS